MNGTSGDIKTEYYDKVLPKLGDISPFIDLANELDSMAKDGRINQMRRVLAVFCYNRQAAAQRELLSSVVAELPSTQVIHNGDELGHQAAGFNNAINDVRELLQKKLDELS